MLDIGLGLTSVPVLGKRGGVAQYLGAVATRSQINSINGFNGAQTDIMTRSMHIARDDITALQLVFANWYVNGPSSVETPTGNTMSLKTSIEYPAGTFTQVKWAGIATSAIASGATGISDLTAVVIPKGAIFWVRVQQHNVAGIMYYSQLANSAIGDRLSFTATDLTMSGTVPDDLSGYTFTPTVIIGQTKKRSVLLIGDSTCMGLKDTADASGDMGNIARSVGPTNAYTNAGIPSESAVNFKTNNTKRLALAQYFSDIFIGYGKNDNQATIQADLATIYALNWSGKRLSAVTVAPQTTGAWTVVNGSDQTVAVNYTALNTFLNGLPSPIKKTFDINPSVSISGTPTKWFAPGYTIDGVHESQAANLNIKATIQASVTGWLQ